MMLRSIALRATLASTFMAALLAGCTDEAHEDSVTLATTLEDKPYDLVFYDDQELELPEGETFTLPELAETFEIEPTEVVARAIEAQAAGVAPDDDEAGQEFPPVDFSEVEDVEVLEGEGEEVPEGADAVEGAGLVEAAAASPYNIEHMWKDHKNRQIILRTGHYDASKPKKGWGLRKVVIKHNLRGKTACFMTRHPLRVGAGNTPTRKEYFGYFQRLRCGWTGCRVTARRVARTVVEFARSPVGSGSLGILTAYCNNPNKAPRCPGWINGALGPNWRDCRNY